MSDCFLGQQIYIKLGKNANATCTTLSEAHGEETIEKLSDFA
jgi:hypothetical protein